MNSNSLYFLVLYIIFNLCSVDSNDYSYDYCFDTNHSQCPQRNYINQKKNITCFCSNDKDFTCDGTRGLDLIFAILSNQVHHSMSFFDSLVVNKCNYYELKTNLFNGIKFKSIELKNCHNVTEFSPHIFGDTSDKVEDLNLELFKNRNDTELIDFWTNVFHSIGHLSRLKRLKMARFNAMIIPDFALKSLSSTSLSITSIHFNNGRGMSFTINKNEH